MATYDYDIANLALARLGQGTISSLGATGRDATVCNLFYAQNRDYCLMQGPWLSVTHRVHLKRAGQVKIGGITSAGAAMLQVLCSGQLYVEGDIVVLDGVTSRTDIEDAEYYVISSDQSQTIALILMSSVTEYIYSATTAGWEASGGFVYHTPGDDWEFVYDLPSTTLHVKRLMNEEHGHFESFQWLRVKDRLYANLENAAIEYIPRETDVSRYDAPLVEYMASRLAWLICPRISSDDSLRGVLFQEMQRILFEARGTSFRNEEETPASSPLWNNARL